MNDSYETQSRKFWKERKLDKNQSKTFFHRRKMQFLVGHEGH